MRYKRREVKRWENKRRGGDGMRVRGGKFGEGREEGDDDDDNDDHDDDDDEEKKEEGG